MNCIYPKELEFIEMGFGLSSEHNPKEGLFSYVYSYKDGTELTVSYSIFENSSFSAKLIINGVEVFNIYQEYITKIAFQTWGSEKIIRIYCNKNEFNIEFRVYYLPQPKVYMATLEA